MSYAQAHPRISRSIPQTAVHRQLRPSGRGGVGLGSDMARLYAARRRRRRRRTAAGFVAVATLLFFGILLAAYAIHPLGSSIRSISPVGEQPESTPQSEWALGTLPYLYQRDAQWADAPYGRGTVGEDGCGPTCLTMVYVALTGNTDYTPATMAAFAEHGDYIEDGKTAWRFMTNGARSLGLSSREIGASEDELRTELEAGHPVICSVRAGDFTTTGHYIVVAGVADNGELIVRDPNSPERSGRTWSFARLLGQCRNLWAFS